MSDGKYAVGNPVRMYESGFDMYGYALEWEGRQLVSVGSVDDYTDVTTVVITFGTWLNGSKMNMIRNGKATVSSVY